MAKPKHRRGRGSSKAGRPRKKGAEVQRYPGGELKRPKINQVLLAHRRALATDPTKSTSPLDCAHANGWLTEREHRTGARYAAIYGQCGFRIGSTSASAGQEVEIESELTKLSLSQMSDDVICQAWDNVMARPILLGSGGDGALLETWNRVNKCLTAAQRQQVFLVCVMDSWPQWLIQRSAGRTLRARFEALAKAEKRGMTDEELDLIFKRENSHWERSREHLCAGLKAIHGALNPPAIHALPPPIESAPRVARKRAESTTYVDPEGNFIREVVRIVATDA